MRNVEYVYEARLAESQDVLEGGVDLELRNHTLSSEELSHLFPHQVLL
jgi:hypothetical protein